MYFSTCSYWSSLFRLKLYLCEKSYGNMCSPIRIEVGFLQMPLNTSAVWPQPYFVALSWAAQPTWMRVPEVGVLKWQVPSLPGKHPYQLVPIKGPQSSAQMLPSWRRHVPTLNVTPLMTRGRWAGEEEGLWSQPESLVVIPARPLPTWCILDMLPHLSFLRVGQRA